MTSRIKILGRMDVVEKRRPQDGPHQDAHRPTGEDDRAAPVDAADGASARSW